jgi:hypothetical protein
MIPQPPADEEPNEFSVLDSTDLLAAFLHAKYGEDALREVFTRVEFYREPLEKAADVLAAKGLAHVADIVADIAASRPSEFDAGCPYSDPINRRYWQQNWIRKHSETPDERLQRMRRQAAGKKRRMH